MVIDAKLKQATIFGTNIEYLVLDDNQNELNHEVNNNDTFLIIEMIKNGFTDGEVNSYKDGEFCTVKWVSSNTR
jgi:hypothetical protein